MLQLGLYVKKIVEEAKRLKVLNGLDSMGLELVIDFDERDDAFQQEIVNYILKGPISKRWKIIESELNITVIDNGHSFDFRQQFQSCCMINHKYQQRISYFVIELSTKTTDNVINDNKQNNNRDSIKTDHANHDNNHNIKSYHRPVASKNNDPKYLYCTIQNAPFVLLLSNDNNKFMLETGHWPRIGTKRFVDRSRGFDTYTTDGVNVSMQYRAYSLGIMEEINEARNNNVAILGQDENVTCGFDVEEINENM
jgi:hypothetical protein